MVDTWDPIPPIESDPEMLDSLAGSDLPPPVPEEPGIWPEREAWIRERLDGFPYLYSTGHGDLHAADSRARDQHGRQLVAQITGPAATNGLWSELVTFFVYARDDIGLLLAEIDYLRRPWWQRLAIRIRYRLAARRYTRWFRKQEYGV